MKWVRRILLFALAGFSLIAIFIVGAAYYGAGKIITRTSSDEHRIIHGNPETALGLACEDVSFKAPRVSALREDAPRERLCRPDVRLPGPWDE
jgi:hypothetical protein